MSEYSEAFAFIDKTLTSEADSKCGETKCRRRFPVFPIFPPNSNAFPIVELKSIDEVADTGKTYIIRNDGNTISFVETLHADSFFLKLDLKTPVTSTLEIKNLNSSIVSIFEVYESSTQRPFHYEGNTTDTRQWSYFEAFFSLFSPAIAQPANTFYGIKWTIPNSSTGTAMSMKAVIGFYDNTTKNLVGSALSTLSFS
jgi:hypothetical protein